MPRTSVVMSPTFWILGVGVVMSPTFWILGVGGMGQSGGSAPGSITMGEGHLGQLEVWSSSSRTLQSELLSCFPLVLLWGLVCRSAEPTQDLLESEEKMPKETFRMGPFLDLPICELSRLGELAELVTSVRLSRNRKDRLAMALRKGGYIPKLVQIFQECESEKNTEGLRLLFDVVRGILYLDKATLFDVMFSDEYVLGVVGCLEYDPCLAQPGKHREFLAKIAELHEIMPVEDPEITKKIRQVSWARYVQTVITPNPSDFEPGFLSTLNSFISYRKREILIGLQTDEAFLPGISALLTNEATAGEHRYELMRFLKEFCAFSFMFREKRRGFVQTLQRLGFLRTLEVLMGIDDLRIRSIATDVLSYLVEFSPTSVQEFVTQEAKQSENDSQLIIKVIEQMTCTPDPGFGGDNRLMEIFCAMIDTDKMLATASYLEVFEFLDIFYDRYIHFVTAPLLADTSENWYEIDNYQTAEILASVLEMLSFCVERHLYHMKTYIIKTDLLRRILALMKSKHKFLALSALRFMRKIIGMKDELYNRYITMGNLFEPVVNAVLDNRRRCNLLKSASLELFEFIQKEGIHYLIAHIVENFSDTLESVKPIHTFQGLKTKYAQEKDLQKEELSSSSDPFTLFGEISFKEPIDLRVAENLRLTEGEEKAAPGSPTSSKDSSPTHTTLATALEPPKRGIFEIFGYPADEDNEATPKKKAHLDS